MIEKTINNKRELKEHTKWKAISLPSNQGKKKSYYFYLSYSVLSTTEHIGKKLSTQNQKF